MHRVTPLTTSLRSSTAGGSRATVDKMDDNSLMQAMSGNYMKNETTKGIESPQNYGFTSHNFSAEKDANGKITGSAETFISFIGGNRSFPATGPVDGFFDIASVNSPPMSRQCHRTDGIDALQVSSANANDGLAELHSRHMGQRIAEGGFYGRDRFIHGFEAADRDSTGMLLPKTQYLEFIVLVGSGNHGANLGCADV